MASFPTNALLTNVPVYLPLGPTVASQIASNIVANGMMSGPYRSIGHFIQLNPDLLSSAVVTTNYTVSQTNDIRREGPIRSVLDALTVRGEQFTIFGLGQSLKSVQGQLKVTGESYQQTVVERVKSINGSSTGVYYRTLYHRAIEE
jgi:hypothetical protein